MSQIIECPLCNKTPDFPLYCRDCKRFYCSNCHQKHLIDFLPKFEVPENIQKKIMNDLISLENNRTGII